MPREVKDFVQGHIVKKRHCHAPNPAIFIPKPVCALNHYTVIPLSVQIELTISLLINTPYSF